MKLFEEMMQQLVLDHTCVSFYIGESGHLSITFERGGLKLNKAGTSKDDFFDVFRALYEQYDRIVHAVPELGPARLTNGAQSSHIEDAHYTDVPF